MRADPGMNSPPPPPSLSTPKPEGVRGVCAVIRWYRCHFRNERCLIMNQQDSPYDSSHQGEVRRFRIQERWPPAMQSRCYCFFQGWTEARFCPHTTSFRNGLGDEIRAFTTGSLLRADRIHFVSVWGHRRLRGIFTGSKIPLYNPFLGRGIPASATSCRALPLYAVAMNYSMIFGICP